jgi:hypothetical protein
MIRSICVLNDTLDRLPCLFQIGRLAREPTQTSISVGHRRNELTTFIYQRVSEIISFARLNLAVSETRSLSIVRRLLADYLDKLRERAMKECRQLSGARSYENFARQQIKRTRKSMP